MLEGILQNLIFFFPKNYTPFIKQMLDNSLHIEKNLKHEISLTPIIPLKDSKKNR